MTTETLGRVQIERLAADIVGRIVKARPYSSRTSAWIDQRQPDTVAAVRFVHGESRSAACGARESADFWKRLVGDGQLRPALLVRLSECGRTVSGRVFDRSSMDELRKQEELPENASMASWARRGREIRKIAEKNGDEVIEKEGWRRRSCGTVTPSWRRRKQVT